jgi:hypothetical protein
MWPGAWGCLRNDRVIDCSGLVSKHRQDNRGTARATTERDQYELADIGVIWPLFPCCERQQFKGTDWVGSPGMWIANCTMRKQVHAREY